MRGIHLVAFGLMAVAATTARIAQASISFATYTVEQVTPLGTTDTQETYGLNNAGHVVVTDFGPNSTGSIYRYQYGTRTPISTPSIYSFARGINDSDSVIGLYNDHQNQPQPLSFISSTAQLTLLPALSPYGNSPGWNYASSINSVGDVVGHSSSPNAFDHAYLYHNGQLNDIGGQIASGAIINNNGVIAGNRYINGFGWRPYIYRDGILTSFGQFNYLVGDINDSDQIVGSTAATLNSNGFVYDGSFHIFALPGASRTDPIAVNNFGQVVGKALLSGNGERAFLYTLTGGIVDLNTLVTNVPTGVVLTQAMGINDSGLIAVNGMDGGVQRVYLLTPVPEPSSAAAVALLLAVGFTARSRRCPTGS